MFKKWSILTYFLYVLDLTPAELSAGRLSQEQLYFTLSKNLSSNLQPFKKFLGSLE